MWTSSEAIVLVAGSAERVLAGSHRRFRGSERGRFVAARLDRRIGRVRAVGVSLSEIMNARDIRLKFRSVSQWANMGAIAAPLAIGRGRDLRGGLAGRQALVREEGWRYAACRESSRQADMHIMRCSRSFLAKGSVDAAAAASAANECGGPMAKKRRHLPCCSWRCDGGPATSMAAHAAAAAEAAEAAASEVERLAMERASERRQQQRHSQPASQSSGKRRRRRRRRQWRAA